MRLLCDFLSQQQPELTPDEITTPMVRSWLVEMKGRGLSGNTIGRRVHALRSFWRYLLDADLVTHDPLRKISLPKRELSLPQYLRAEELRAILDATQQHPDVLTGIRNYALMATCIFTGVRRGELIGLRLGDFDPPAGLLRVHGKGGRWRVIPLAPEARQAIADWLELRPGNRSHDYLFTTVRPSAATLLLQTGTCDIVQIQRLLGHSRLDTTAIYLHVEPADLEKAMQRHPLQAGS